MTTETFVIAGSSIAGITAARELRRGGFNGKILMIDRDHRAPYRRPEVSKSLLTTEANHEKVMMPWPTDLEAERLVGVDLVDLDVHAHVIRASRGGEMLDISYDGLVIATGCQSREALSDGPIPVHTLRSAADAERFGSELAVAEHLLVVGAGFIGMEVAAGASAQGKQVTVVEPMELPLAHVLGADFGGRLLEMHQNYGIEFHLGTQVGTLAPGPTGRVRARLTNGRAIETDVVLVAVGARPSVDWLMGSGINTEQGVACDSTCAVFGAPDVVAAGDVAFWENPLYDRPMRVEHWANAIEQASYAARRLLGTHDPAGFRSAPYFWSDQHGRKIQSIGSTWGYDQTEVIDDDAENFVVAYFREGRLLAVAGLATGAAIPRFKELVLNGAGLDDVVAHYRRSARKVA